MAHSGLSPVRYSVSNELRPVVTTQHCGSNPLSNQFLEMNNEAVSSDRTLDQPAQTFTGVLIYDRAHLERFTLLKDIKRKIHAYTALGAIAVATSFV